MNRFKRLLRENWKPTLFYAGVALLVLWPLLAPGYILTLDMVFAPKLALPETVTSSYLLHAGLHLLNMVIPSDVIQKIMLFAILILSGLGMHWLMRFLQLRDISTTTVQWAAYASGLLYMINPFVYSRFMAGQYSVLLGYVFLPFFVAALLRFFYDPSFKKAMVLAVWTIGIGIVSIHALGLAFVVALIASSQAIWRYRADAQRLKRFMKWGVAAILVFLVASSYWLLPLLQGSGPTAASIATFRTSDQSAFATEGNGVVGKLVHVLRLQGFWGEQQGLYLLPQDELRVWGLAVILIWALVIVGAIAAWRSRREFSVLFVGSIVIAALLATGIGTSWLSNHIPFFAGYREPQKFVAIIALSYAVLVGFAVATLAGRIRSKIGRSGLAISFVLVLVGFTPVMFRGFDGQLVPRQYPADWYAVNEQLNKDGDTYKVLFLPWHLYMRYQFAGRVIANPGDAFFDKPLLTSDDPELDGVSPAIANAQKQLLTMRILPQAPMSNTIGHQLVPLNIKYVLLAKDNDYQKYDYLEHQTDLQLVTESATLKLYRNTAFGKDSR